MGKQSAVVLINLDGQVKTDLVEQITYEKISLASNRNSQLKKPQMVQN